MRITALCFAAALLAPTAACQDITAPPAPLDEPAFVVHANQQTGPSNRCYGDIIAGIARTWPWAHEDKVAFEPPPGAIALWIELFGEELGISNVRDLQLLFCTSA